MSISALIGIGVERIITQGRHWFKSAYFKVERIDPTDDDSFTSDEPIPEADHCYIYVAENDDGLVVPFFRDTNGDDWEWGNAAGGSGPYTDEQAQDAVGNILTDTSSIDFTYDDATPTISAAVLPAGVDHNSLANLTTGNPHTQYVLRSILTTNGDLFVRLAGVVDRVGVGAEDQILTVVGGLPSWANAPETGGHILLSDTRSTPFSFNDCLQMDDGSDFMWTDPS